MSALRPRGGCASVIHERNGEPFRVEKVWIVPEQRLLEWLRTQHGRPVLFERLARYADHIS